MSINYDKCKDRSKWGICLSCKTNRYIVSRGLCMKCWKEPDIRKRFERLSIVPRNPITPEQRELLSNSTLTEPNKLFYLAYRIMCRYGARIQIDDLKQIGWLVMIKCVKDFDINWKHTTLFKYCKRGISSEMERHCINELRSSTMGVTHEDFIDYIANDAITRQLKGGLSRYSLGQTFFITDHALKRYRERIKESGTRKELQRIVECSTRLPREREEIWLTKYNSSLHEVREYGDIILIMGPSLHLWSKQQGLITVMDKNSPF